MEHPLKIGIFDTTVTPRLEALHELLSQNGISVIVRSVHTAAAKSDGEPYHWVTVVYEKAER